MKSPQSTVSMADKVALIDSLCAKARILPVITIAREQDILPLADALAAGGLTALEVTLRSEFGLKAIQVLREQRPELCTGAGTVLDRHMLEAAEVAEVVLFQLSQGARSVYGQDWMVDKGYTLR